jgi:hypothetical protein
MASHTSLWIAAEPSPVGGEACSNFSRELVQNTLYVSAQSGTSMPCCYDRTSSLFVKSDLDGIFFRSIKCRPCSCTLDNKHSSGFGVLSSPPPTYFALDNQEHDVSAHDVDEIQSLSDAVIGVDGVKRYNDSTSFPCVVSSLVFSATDLESMTSTSTLVFSTIFYDCEMFFWSLAACTTPLGPVVDVLDVAALAAFYTYEGSPTLFLVAL